MACCDSGLLSSRKNVFLKAGFDFLCVAIVGIALLAIKYGTEPYHRGFFCGDESIQHPVLSDTISVPLVTSIGVIVPIVLVIGTEWILRNGHTFCIEPKEVRGRRAKTWYQASYSVIAAFLFGMAVSQLLTEIGKYSVGRLRPYFLTLCAPDFTKVDCTQGYITDDVCTTNDEDELKEARLSFPSGHSSFAVYCMVYLTLYLQARVSMKTVIYLKPVILLAPFSFAFYTCLSRISDYKHHWSDVLGGAIIGIVVCVCVVVALTDFGKLLCRSQVTVFNDNLHCLETQTMATSIMSQGSMAKMDSGEESARNSKSHVINIEDRSVLNNL